VDKRLSIHKDGRIFFTDFRGISTEPKGGAYYVSRDLWMIGIPDLPDDGLRAVCDWLSASECNACGRVSGLASHAAVCPQRREGIAILSPIVGRKKSIDGELLEDEQTRIFGFKTAHVLD
jgi:hypothetical protein